MGPILFALLALSLQASFHLYVWRRLIHDTGLSRRTRRLATTVMVALGVATPATLWLHRAGLSSVSEPLGWVTFPWLALVGLLVLLLAVIDLVRVMHFLGREVATSFRPPAGDAPAAPPDPTRRAALARLTGGAAVAVSGAAIGVGVREALGAVRVVDVPVTLPRLGRDLDGFTIVQLTDLHVGFTIGRGYVADVVARAMALTPDLIVLTGDLVDGSVADLRDRVAPLAGLRAPHGVFVVPGNHEHYSGVEAWLPAFVALGLEPLRNRRVPIHRGAASFELAGVDDWTSAAHGSVGADYDLALAGRDPALPVILLAHQPRQVRAAARRGVDLQLSGHTHGGQIWPWHYIASAQQGGLVAGYYRVGDTQLYVSRGCGYWGPPIRLGAPPEITRIVLRAPA